MGQNVKKIKTATGIKEYQGKHNIGVVFQDTDAWYNAYGTEEELKVLEPMLKKGNTISYDFKDGGLINLSLIEKSDLPETPHPAFQDDIVNFETLLNDAHKKLNTKETSFRIHTELIDRDMDKKYAIVHATLTVFKIDDEKILGIYQAYGDATDENCQSSFIKPHFIRMAETRAICRTLRWATNNAATAEEEKGGN